MFNLISNLLHPASLIFFDTFNEANLTGKRLNLFFTGIYRANGII